MEVQLSGCAAPATTEPHLLPFTIKKNGEMDGSRWTDVIKERARSLHLGAPPLHAPCTRASQPFRLASLAAAANLMGDEGFYTAAFRGRILKGKRVELSPGSKGELTNLAHLSYNRIPLRLPRRCPAAGADGRYAAAGRRRVRGGGVRGGGDGGRPGERLPRDGASPGTPTRHTSPGVLYALVS